MITDDTLNVPTIRCGECKKAEEIRHREEKILHERVDFLLKRMNGRQQSSLDKGPFQPWTHDKFERPMFTHIRRQVYANAIILTELGFVQSKTKPWLFLFHLPDGVVFANFGSTEEVAIWKNPAALIHWDLGAQSDRLNALLVEGLLARCRAVGAHVRVSFYDGMFDQQRRPVGNSLTDGVDGAVLDGLLAEAARIFSETELRLIQIRQAMEAQRAAIFREQAARAEKERQRREAVANERRAEREQWKQLNKWIKEQSTES